MRARLDLALFEVFQVSQLDASGVDEVVLNSVADVRSLRVVAVLGIVQTGEALQHELLAEDELIPGGEGLCEELGGRNTGVQDRSGRTAFKYTSDS